MRYPDRVRKIFAFATAATTWGEKYSAFMNSTIVASIKRTYDEYHAYSCCAWHGGHGQRGTRAQREV
jgi:hypothetical protein